MNNKLVAFFSKCQELNVPTALSAFAYMELVRNSYTPEKFYTFFEGVYSRDEIFYYLKEMIDHGLLLFFDVDDELDFDDCSFLTLNVAYDPRLNIYME